MDTLTREITLKGNICLPSHLGLLFKGRICSLWEQILFFKNCPHFWKVSKIGRQLLVCKSSPFDKMVLKSSHCIPSHHDIAKSKDPDHPCVDAHLVARLVNDFTVCTHTQLCRIINCQGSGKTRGRTVWSRLPMFVCHNFFPHDMVSKWSGNQKKIP